jgi:hypothetical protein
MRLREDKPPRLPEHTDGRTYDENANKEWKWCLNKGFKKSGDETKQDKSDKTKGNSRNDIVRITVEFMANREERADE